MRIEIDALREFHARGRLVQGDWGDARETACLMSALTGATDDEGCAAAGWPLWLAELGRYCFDSAPEDEAFGWAVAFAEAVKAADARGVDWDRVFRDIRLRAVLPIALESIGAGDEPWRVACREAVQWSIDHDGGANPRAAAGAAEAARAARAARAAWAAEAAEAAGAAWAAEAAEAAGAAAWARIRGATLDVLREAVNV